jgi:Acetyltransferase (GNAT) domain
LSATVVGRVWEQNGAAESVSGQRGLDEDLELKIVDPERDTAWDHVIALHRDSSCFHTSAWAKVLRQTYKHKPFYLQFSRGRRLVALVPLMEVRSPFTGRRGISLPFSDACEPLMFDAEAAGKVKERLIAFTREQRWNYLEIRGGSLQLSPEPTARFYGHMLDLRGGAEELSVRFASSVRRAIRKAERSGLNVAVARNRKVIADFYQLHARTRRRHGLPPQPLSFFLKIYEHIVKTGLGFVVLAQRELRPVAGAIFFRFGESAVYKFGASDETRQELRANNLVIWEGIKYLVRNGAETLHFGRTDIGNDGLRRFKLSWGTQEDMINYFRVAPSGSKCLAPARHDAGFHNRIFRRLPLVLNRLAGSIIYPHLD